MDRLGVVRYVKSFFSSNYKLLAQLSQLKLVQIIQKFQTLFSTCSFRDRTFDHVFRTWWNEIECNYRLTEAKPAAREELFDYFPKEMLLFPLRLNY